MIKKYHPKIYSEYRTWCIFDIFIIIIVDITLIVIMNILLLLKPKMEQPTWL